MSAREGHSFRIFFSATQGVFCCFRLRMSCHGRWGHADFAGNRLRCARRRRRQWRLGGQSNDVGRRASRAPSPSERLPRGEVAVRGRVFGSSLMSMALSSWKAAMHMHGHHASAYHMWPVIIRSIIIERVERCRITSHNRLLAARIREALARLLNKSASS